ncbi:unnamed protein product [Periconia digitata]|uniref:Uncharacterized protein n=1 Tax=Periconia digitata TaxID=1303443 RepID=A0A9W4XLN2_9PLEO|nr:unnamed protein product [Periconia digitata]
MHGAIHRGLHRPMRGPANSHGPTSNYHSLLRLPTGNRKTHESKPSLILLPLLYLHSYIHSLHSHPPRYCNDYTPGRPLMARGPPTCMRPAHARPSMRYCCHCILQPLFCLFNCPIRAICAYSAAI